VAATAPARLAWIEACRGIAATAVVLYHVARHFDTNYGMPSLKAVFQFGHAGVDLFFVISGFVILFVHLDDVGKPERLRRYAGRRLTRVLPIYWIAVALMIAKKAAGGHGTSVADMAWAIIPVPIVADPVLGVAWTLQYEFVFYVAFAVMILNRTAGAVIMAAWLAIILIIAATVGRIGLPEAYWGISNLEFFTGMAVAYWLRNSGLRQYKIVLAAGIVLFVLACIAEDMGGLNGYGPLARFAYGLPAALIVLGGAEASRRSNVRVPSILRILGGASYSIYLFHFMLMGILWQFWLKGGLDKIVPTSIGFVVFALGAIAAGVVISRLVEYPLMRLIPGASGRLRVRETAGIGPDVLY
jgi:exopolysaccharide production protein ExoZ